MSLQKMSVAYADRTKYTLGFDIYHGDDDHGDVQFGAAANADRDFCMIKASQGTYNTDPHFKDHIVRANIVASQRDFLPTAYHFMTDEDGKSQMVNRFLPLVLPYIVKGKFLKLVLDNETDPSNGTKPSPENIAEAAHEIKVATGYYPILYFGYADYVNTYRSWFPTNLYTIMLARYATNDPTPNPDPLVLPVTDIAGVKFGQITGTGRIPGQSPQQNFDEDVYFGNFADLLATQVIK